MTEMLDFEEFKRRYQEVPVEEYPNRVREAVPDPLLTVHLITYNHADYIRKAIESVLMQEVDFPMEIVLGDDDSSDGTREICMEYAERNPGLIRLQLHHRENNHKLHGRPTHLFQYWHNSFSLRGEYFAVLSGDDYWTDPEKLSKQVCFLQSNEKFSLSFHDAYIANENDKTLKSSKLPKKNKKNLSRVDLMKGPYLPALSIVGINVFSKIPKEAMKCLNEDKFTISILGEQGKGSYQKEVKKATYRSHKGSLWSSETNIRKQKALSETFEKLKKYHIERGNKDVYNYCKHRQLKHAKKIYYESVKTEKFKSSLELFYYVVKKHAKNKEYHKGTKFTIYGLKYLVRKVRKNVRL